MKYRQEDTGTKEYYNHNIRGRRVNGATTTTTWHHDVSIAPGEMSTSNGKRQHFRSPPQSVKPSSNSWTDASSLHADVHATPKRTSGTTRTVGRDPRVKASRHRFRTSNQGTRQHLRRKAQLPHLIWPHGQPYAVEEDPHTTAFSASNGGCNPRVATTGHKTATTRAMWKGSPQRTRLGLLSQLIHRVNQ